MMAFILVSSPSSANVNAELNVQLQEFNVQLADQGLSIAEIQFFTFGAGRPSARILQQPFNWVANDGRRAAQGVDITYIVDQTFGATASGVSNAQTEAAVDSAMTTWDSLQVMRKVDLVKRSDPGTDVTIFDSFFPATGDGSGNPFAADIVNAGWHPGTAFNNWFGLPNNILAFSVTFTFVNPDGSPSDANGDGYIDTALNEVYYNDQFGTPNTPRAGFPWGINVNLPGIDIETVALHENGHSLGVGHFGPPPAAVMNPVYAGIRHTPFPIDKAGLATVWSNWPN